MEETQNYIAVSQADFDKYGCPYCGCSSRFEANLPQWSWMDTTLFTCMECKQRSAILLEDLAKSSIGFGKMVDEIIDGVPKPVVGPTVYPLLQKHPREGTLAHAYVEPPQATE